MDNLPLPLKKIIFPMQFFSDLHLLSLPSSITRNRIIKSSFFTSSFLESYRCSRICLCKYIYYLNTDSWRDCFLLNTFKDLDNEISLGKKILCILTMFISLQLARIPIFGTCFCSWSTNTENKALNEEKRNTEREH